MKKIFIKPEIQIVQLDNNDLICTSLEYGGDGPSSAEAEARRIWWGDDEW